MTSSPLELCSPTTTPSPPYVAGRLAGLVSTTPPAVVNVQPAHLALTDRYVFWRIVLATNLLTLLFHRTEWLVELERIQHQVHLSARFVRMGRSPRVRGVSCR